MATKNNNNIKNEEESLESLRAKYKDRYEELFFNKTLFITGGTGFLGKVLIEKILRVYEVRKIFLLVRTKKGKSPEDRLQEFFVNPLFEMLKELKSEERMVEKIQLVSGDCTEPDLGLSKKDREAIINEVDFIFHCAATVRFDEELKKAVLMNVRGTKLMLQLAKECKKLQMFCHMSTAYCHLNERVLYEKAYPPPADPDAVIQTCEVFNQDIISSISKKLLSGFPNSYAFTKALGEALVVNEMDNLPVIILRPSVVIPIWKEPIPGWTDNINGPTGLIIGAGKGVIRSMYCKGETYSDYVPVDVVVNSMICCIGDQLIHKSSRRIFNITSSSEYKISFEEILNIGRKVIEERIPLNGVFWYPGGSMKTSRILHLISFFLFQWVPAVVVDCLLVILGYDPVLKRVQRRILKGYDVFEYYANNQWDFSNETSTAARDLLNPLERRIYKLDGDGIDYEDYFTECTYGARRYILNEQDDTISSAKRHLRIMWWADTICKTVIVTAFFYFVVWKWIILGIFG